MVQSDPGDDADDEEEKDEDFMPNESSSTVLSKSDLKTQASPNSIHPFHEAGAMFLSHQHVRLHGTIGCVKLDDVNQVQAVPYFRHAT